MGNRRKTAPQTPDLFVPAKDFFSEMVSAAFAQTGVKTIPQAQHYLEQLLQHYMITEHLYDEEDSSGRKTRDTLAELYLRAHSAEDSFVKFELLKKLGDSSLYITGFFSGSLQRKLVDVDYYAEMGGVAYADLARFSREDTASKVFGEFSKRFLEFVDVLNVIANKSNVTSEENLLRLFDLYAQTGSQVIREQLWQKGYIPQPPANLKKRKV